MIPVDPGEKIPLMVVVDTGATNLNVRAKVVNRVTGAVLYAAIVLAYDGTTASYRNTTGAEFPDDDEVQFIDVTYSVRDAADAVLLKLAGEVFVSTAVLGGEGGGGGGDTIILGTPIAGVVNDESVVIGIITEC